MNRGSVNRVNRANRANPGFNEAPIHESGKYSASAGSTAAARRLQ